MKNTPRYLTLVFKQPISDQVKQVFLNAEWSAASHNHAIHDRLKQHFFPN